MGLAAIYPRPKLSRPGEGKQNPYLLWGWAIERPDQVWASDITSVPIRGGYLYLTAVIDWYSRYVLSWELSGVR